MPTTDYVNPQANFIEDDDVKKFIKGDTATPKFDSQSAQPLKTIPQLFTNRSARYVRPETEEERGQATADYLTGTKPSPIEKEDALPKALKLLQDYLLWLVLVQKRLVIGFLILLPQFVELHLLQD